MVGCNDRFDTMVVDAESLVDGKQPIGMAVGMGVAGGLLLLILVGSIVFFRRRAHQVQP